MVETSLDGTAALRTAADADAAVTALDGEDVDCVALGSEVGEDDGFDVVRALRSRDGDLPAVFAPADPDGSEAAAATATGATQSLPRSDTDSFLASAVEDLAGTATRDEDGAAWTVLDRNVLALPGAVAVGLAVNSHVADTPTEAAFTDVKLVELEHDPSL